MNTIKTRLCTYALAGAALLGCGILQGVSAQTAYDPYGRPYAGEPQVVYGDTGRPLTVVPRHRASRPLLVAPTYSPYDGPQAIVTAPIAAASTLVALPFRVVNGVFPPYGDPARNPLVIVGAPVHAAGQVAQLPFRAMQAPFGGWDYPEY